MSHDYQGEPRPLALAFGAALRAAREERGVSQEWLAEASGLDSTYPSILERGLRMPTIAVVYKLADGLGLNPLYLLANTFERIQQRKPLRLYFLAWRESEGSLVQAGRTYLSMQDAIAGWRLQNAARTDCGQPELTHVAVYAQISVAELRKRAPAQS